MLVGVYVATLEWAEGVRQGAATAPIPPEDPLNAQLNMILNLIIFI